MKRDFVQGFRSIYQGLVGALFCWFLFVGAYLLQYGQGVVGHYVSALVSLTHFTFSVAEVGMVLSMVAILIGLTDVSNRSSRMSKVRFWYYMCLLMYLALAVSEVLLMVQTPGDLTQTNPLQKYHFFFLAGYVMEFAFMVLSNLFAEGNLLKGFSETLALYGAGNEVLQRMKDVRKGLTVACVGETVTFLFIVVVTRTVYISELSGLLHSGPKDGAAGVLHIALGVLFGVFLLLRVLAEIQVVKSGRQVYETLRELGE